MCVCPIRGHLAHSTETEAFRITRAVPDTQNFNRLLNFVHVVVNYISVQQNLANARALLHWLPNKRAFSNF
jgi:hypothetical protein